MNTQLDSNGAEAFFTVFTKKCKVYINTAEFSMKLLSFIYFSVAFVRQLNASETVIVPTHSHLKHVALLKNQSNSIQVT